VITASDPADPLNITGLWNPLPELLRGRRPAEALFELRQRRKFFGHEKAFHDEIRLLAYKF